MIKKILSSFTFFGTLTMAFSQTQLYIPPTINSSNINLTLDEGTFQFYPGVVTNTMGANGNLLGPTIILNKGDFYNITVDNQLSDTTTIHWHGLHVAPENDGGPHTIILPNDIWNPQFTVLDKAGTYWYHPHLHKKTDKHVSLGIAGMILVRDSEEASLNLPMSYGVDEFPLVLQTKGFDANGQIEIHTENDTSVMVNGIVDATVDMPAQVVRLRVLNGSSQRVMVFGFSDNRTFSLIGTDGGLLTAPVNLTRYRLGPGQRIDVLVDLSSDLGQSLQIMSYGSELTNGYYGATNPGMAPFMTIPGYNQNPLNGADFQLLNINVVAQTANPITTIPATLANYSPIPEANSVKDRELVFSSAGGMGDLQGPFLINNASMDMNVINEYVPFNNTEIWTLRNQTPIAHPFHIHDVQFFILDINGNPPPPEMQGLNDVVIVPPGQGTVRFIAIFNDVQNDSIPFMYHCHMLTHEDMGMMGQFLVSDKFMNTEDDEVNQLSIYPNPSNGSFKVMLFGVNNVQALRIYNLQGKEVFFKYQIETNQISIDLTEKVAKGTYYVTIQTSDKTYTSKFVIQ
ncbi:MAG TPA: T9SS type A sorting domain-containing protein [Crocinitomix sp.]|nr:T9SS type A sorting domain-containing protein [Crocinitomix sp.]